MKVSWLTCRSLPLTACNPANQDSKLIFRNGQAHPLTESDDDALFLGFSWNIMPQCRIEQTSCMKQKDQCAARGVCADKKNGQIVPPFLPRFFPNLPRNLLAKINDISGNIKVNFIFDFACKMKMSYMTGSIDGRCPVDATLARVSSTSSVDPLILERKLQVLVDGRTTTEKVCFLFGIHTKTECESIKGEYVRTGELQLECEAEKHCIVGEESKKSRISHNSQNLRNESVCATCGGKWVPRKNLFVANQWKSRALRHVKGTWKKREMVQKNEWQQRPSERDLSKHLEDVYDEMSKERIRDAMLCYWGRKQILLKNLAEVFNGRIDSYNVSQNLMMNHNLNLKELYNFSEFII